MVQSSALSEWFAGLAAQFERNFLASNRWLQLLNGLEVTLFVH